MHKPVRLVSLDHIGIKLISAFLLQKRSVAAGSDPLALEKVPSNIILSSIKGTLGLGVLTLTSIPSLGKGRGKRLRGLYQASDLITAPQ